MQLATQQIGAIMNWNIFENLLINISFSLLLFSLIIYWATLAIPKLKLSNRVGKAFALIINFCLFTSLLMRWISNGYFPLSNLYESLLFLAWCISFTQLVLENKYSNIIIGAISSPINLLIVSFAGFVLPAEMQTAAPLVPALRSNWLMMHVTVMMISYASLIIGSLLSVVFLILSQKNKKYRINDNAMLIKTGKRSSLAKITLLESIDNLSYRVIGLGFPLLTLGIIAGAVWANEAWGSYWSWDPKETWALITWLIFASYLHSRLNKSWSGEKPAILASIGFLVVWICYLGVNFLGKGLHSYGWLQ